MIRKARSFQSGALAVEFSLIAIVFVTLLLAVVEFGRWLAALESVTHATRTGARMAAVCDIGTKEVKERILALTHGISLNATQVDVQHSPLGCTAATCLTVTVRINGASIDPALPFLSGALPVPGFPSVMTRESLRTRIDQKDNPGCFCNAAGGTACV